MSHFEDLSLLELAETISAKARTLHEYLEAKKMEQPSLLNPDSQLDYLSKGGTEIKDVRAELRAAARQIDALAAGSLNVMIDQVVCAAHDANAMRLVWMYEVPKHVPTSGSISYPELAKKTGFNEDKLTRVVRYVMNSFIFTEPEPGFVAHSATSRLLIEPTAWAWYGHMADDCHPAIASTPEAFTKWGSDTLSHKETGTQIYFQTPDDFFTYMSQYQPERVERFGKAMQFSTQALMASVFHFDWAKLGKVKIVDLGGSFGAKSIAIAQAAPEVTCIVQDLEDCIAKAPPVPPEVAERISFEAQNFFTPQQRTDMDIVFLARVFHDWPDADCFRILENLVPAMRSGCRLILNDFIKTPPFSLPLPYQRTIGAFDLHMMVLLNARERSADEFKKLIDTGSNGQLEYEWHTSEMISFIKK